MSKLSNKYGQGSGPKRLPDISAPDEDILGFFNRYFNFFSIYRCRHMDRMNKALWYYLGRQWIELDTDVLINGARGFVYRDARNLKPKIPRPVTNRIMSAVEIELSSLNKRELTSKVITSSKDVNIEAAAKVADEILQHRLEVLDWADIRSMATLLNVVCGTSAIKSYWDETFEQMTMVGAPNAVQCPNCPTTLASPVVSPDLMQQMPTNHTETVQPVGDQGLMTNCPTCEMPTPMIPAELDEQQAAGNDYYGRPLGMQVPKGNTGMEVVSPFDLFPENSGIGVRGQDIKMWGQASVRSLDWLEARYPLQIEDIQPEPAEELMETHPLLGEWALSGRYNVDMDSGIYDNHVRVFELTAEKSIRNPQGRHIVVVGQTVLENGPLYIVNKDGVEVKRVNFAAARWRERHGEFWGQSLVDDLVSPQNRLNGMDSQMTDTRERIGSPHIMASEGMDLSDPGFFEDYGSARIFRYNTDPLNPSAKPETFGGQLFPTGVFQERDRVIQDMKEIAGPQDVEIGEAPKNISTTSGLQILGEQAERRRATRERALIDMFEKTWEHQLRLVWGYRYDTDEYEHLSDSGDYEIKQYDRNAMAGQTKVQIEKKAYVDKSLYQSEAVREAIADGLYRLDSQVAIKKILEYRNLPTDVNSDLNYQVELSKRQWSDFTQEGIIPVIDPTLDDFLIRFQALGTFLLGDEGQRIAKQSGWFNVVKLLAGWQEELAHKELMDAQTVAFYGTRNPDPQAANQMYAQGMMNYKQEMAGYEEQVQSGEQAAAAGMAPMPIQPPMEPPPPVFLPAAKEDRVYMTWMELIMKGGGQIDSVLDPFLKFRAVVDAYGLLAKEQAMAMMPQPAAPGTPGGNPGTGGANPGVQFPGVPNPPNVNATAEVPGARSNMGGSNLK